MTQIAPTIPPIDAATVRLIQEVQRTRALTERQIEAACKMWREPDKWRLLPTGIGTRNLYAHTKQRT